MGMQLKDEPKSLGDSVRQAERRSKLHLPHIDQLTFFVDAIRRERICGDLVPYFDPFDGGISAECLFVLEAPGANAVASGFISRNNPDETAKNWFELNVLADLARQRTITANIVPWYIGSNGRIREATSKDIEEGWPYLMRLLNILPRLRVVVLVGKKAQRVDSRLQAVRPDLTIHKCRHPSPLSMNRAPGNRSDLLSALKALTRMLERDELPNPPLHPTASGG